MDKCTFMDRWGSVRDGDKSGLPAQRTLRRSCEMPVLCLDCKSWEHILLPMAVHHRPASADLRTYLRAHLVDKLHLASEGQRPARTVGERKKTGSLNAVKVSTTPGAGGVASRTQPLPLLLPLPLHFAHRKENFNFMSIFQFAGGCFIPLLV